MHSDQNKQFDAEATGEFTRDDADAPGQSAGERTTDLPSHASVAAPGEVTSELTADLPAARPGADPGEATGELTPSLKVKRNVVCKEYADEIAAIYGS